jgi:hypothetical protein
MFVEKGIERELLVSVNVGLVYELKTRSVLRSIFLYIKSLT